MTLNFGGLNANSSKTVKVTELKFDVHVPRDSTDVTHHFFFKKGVWPGSLSSIFVLSVRLSV